MRRVSHLSKSFESVKKSGKYNFRERFHEVFKFRTDPIKVVNHTLAPPLRAPRSRWFGPQPRYTTQHGTIQPAHGGELAGGTTTYSFHDNTSLQICGWPSSILNKNEYKAKGKIKRERERKMVGQSAFAPQSRCLTHGYSYM